MFNWLFGKFKNWTFIPHDTMTVQEYDKHVKINNRNKLKKLVEEKKLASLSKKELLKLADECDIKVSASLRKADLIKKLSVD
jgi:sialic acid synthase SpsE